MRHTVEALIDLMRTKPFTFRWNAMVAYDRSKTNKVLAQEYISRFSTTSYFAPFSGSVPTTGNEVEFVYDYLVDAPRLSFENSIITASRALLTMKVLGGSQLSIATESGRDAAVIRVAAYDALQGPKLTMDIDLMFTQGTVTAGGRVDLDLKEGRQPLLYFGPTLNQREKGGAFMLNKFKSLGPTITIFTLNEMNVDNDQFLKMEYFCIRTHAEPGAKIARAANAGEGAVLMFVTMEGENNGTYPATDDDLDFLIPSGNYSSSTLLGQSFLLSRILIEGLREVAVGSVLTYQNTGVPDGFIDSVEITGGVHKGVSISSRSTNFDNITLNGFRLPMAGDFTLTKVANGEQLRVDWRGSSAQECTVTLVNGPTYPGNVVASWSLSLPFQFELQGEAGELKLIPVSVGRVEQVKIAPGTYADNARVSQYFAEIADYLEHQLSAELNTCMTTFVAVVESIDAFRLNNLLFRGENIVRFTSARSPGDLVLFGELAPELTAFVIAPLEPVIGHSSEQPFFTEPSGIQGLTWAVENIEGHTGNAGTINPATGVYTAPPQTDIDGFFVRVRVKASTATHHSYALVTVVTRPIVINPLIQVCNASKEGQPPQTREVAAGALAGGDLNWSIVGNTGSSVVPSQMEGGDHTFVARTESTNKEEWYTLDEILVTDSAGNSDSSWVIVVHKVLLGEVKIDLAGTLPDHQVKLVFDLGEGPMDGVEWALVKGSGSIDESTGIFTSDPNGVFRFALITAYLPPPIPAYPPFYSFIILPLPLVDFPTLVKTLDTSNAYFKAVAQLGMDEAARVAGLS